jgi:hypothetical protein
MAITLKQLEAELDRKRAELAELEIAIRVHRRIESETRNGEDVSEKTRASKSHTATTEDLSGKTMRECAEIILAEKAPLGYREVAAEAMRRGYRSPKGGDENSVTQSFWATMNRAKERFRSEGDGKYSLVQSPS